MSLNTNARARISSPVAPLQREARVSSAQISQLVFGQTVQLIEQQGDWWRVAGADAYEGFMHTGYLKPASGTESTWRLSLGVTVRSPTGELHSLPFNARFALSDELVSGEAVDASQIQSRFPASASAVVLSAAGYFAGASYLWGGVTPWGCDCSGLVQSVFQLHGIQLPRDAWQQASIGTAVAMEAPLAVASIGALQPGDLLYFSDRDDKHVTHVGLMSRDGAMVHSSLRRGGVRLEQLGSDEYYVQQLRANFLCARRLSLSS